MLCANVVVSAGGGGAAVTTRLKLFELVCAGLAESVTVTVYAVDVSGAFGVPLRYPVAALKVSPNEVTDGLIAYESVPYPPVALIGWKAVDATNCANVTVAVGIEVTSAGYATAMLTVWLLVCETESVAVTVILVAATIAVGVPLISPVDVLKDNPVKVELITLSVA